MMVQNVREIEYCWLGEANYLKSFGQGWTTEFERGEDNITKSDGPKGPVCC